jgi:hypothetical protein
MGRLCQWITVSTVACLAVGCHLPGLGGAAAADGGDTGAAIAAALADAAIENPAAAGGSCPSGQVAILLQNGSPYCVMSCAKTSDCPTGWACDGDGVVDSEGEAGASVKFCNQAGHHPPSGTVTAADGGKVNVADAGKPAVVDAGPPKLLDVKQTPPGSGKCPAGYGVCGAACRLHCSKDGDCGGGSVHCQGGFCLGPNAKVCSK